ncbi:hypothetical protein ABPG75_006261 [Micractinium tetrahymenae]
MLLLLLGAVTAAVEEAAPAPGADRGGSADGGPVAQPLAGQEVVALKQSDFLLLVLLVVALFYLGAAVIYRIALHPSKEARLAADAARRQKRD